MTAEVAVYNKTAIALAADSAATISSGRMHKIYNNAEKLFALTKYHPVGIMVFGSGDFVDTPWELIIKSYRKHLGSKSFPKLEEYVSDFMLFIPSFIKKLDIDFERYLKNEVFGFYEYIESRSQECDTPTENLESIISVLEIEIDKLIGEEAVYLDNFSYKDVASTQKQLRPIINYLLDALELKELPRELVSKFRKHFLKFSTYALLKDHNFDMSKSGLVFAGYGDDEYFPLIYTFDIRGLHKERLRSILVKDKCATQRDIAGIVPFAQQSEVESFMQGITDDHVSKYMSNTETLIKESFVEFVEIIEDLEGVEEEVKDESTKRMFNFLFQTSQRLTRDFIGNIRENHIAKIVSMIEHLPKNELSYMAESLVNLTAFKRKVSYETDTVGGPIDVAIISKGDGFVWVKRKHYFPIELNRDHYLQCQGNRND